MNMNVNVEYIAIDSGRGDKRRVGEIVAHSHDAAKIADVFNTFCEIFATELNAANDEVAGNAAYGLGAHARAELGDERGKRAIEALAQLTGWTPKDNQFSVIELDLGWSNDWTPKDSFWYRRHNRLAVTFH